MLHEHKNRHSVLRVHIFNLTLQFLYYNQLFLFPIQHFITLATFLIYYYHEIAC
jgi:hypothetical protein